MNSGPVQIDFRGLHPTDEIRESIDTIVEEIHEESPKYSSLHVHFSRAGRAAVQGVVLISSHAGSFYTRAIGTDLELVTKQLLAQMRRQFSKIKTRRVQNHVGLKHLKPILQEN